MKHKPKEKLFSVTASDCTFKAFIGSGPGGQHRNKVATAIRCMHKPSGAVGVSTKEKSQHRNKRLAFGRMARSTKMREWIRLEAARLTGEFQQVEDTVKTQMKPHNIKTEVHDDRGLWLEVKNMEDLDD